LGSRPIKGGRYCRIVFARLRRESTRRWEELSISSGKLSKSGSKPSCDAPGGLFVGGATAPRAIRDMAGAAPSRSERAIHPGTYAGGSTAPRAIRHNAWEQLFVPSFRSQVQLGNEENNLFLPFAPLRLCVRNSKRSLEIMRGFAQAVHDGDPQAHLGNRFGDDKIQARFIQMAQGGEKMGRCLA